MLLRDSYRYAVRKWYRTRTVQSYIQIRIAETVRIVIEQTPQYTRITRGLLPRVEAWLNGWNEAGDG